jgi:hypothetical protein
MAAAVVLGACSIRSSGIEPVLLHDEAGAAADLSRTKAPIVDARGDLPGLPPSPDALALDGPSPIVAPPRDGPVPVDAPESDRPPPPPADAAPPDLLPDRPQPDLPPPVEIRIAVNGPAHVGVGYPGRWAADPGVGGICSPTPFSNDAPIHNTQDGPLFHREMFGSPLVCAVGGGKLPPGRYQVNLYFAEIYWGPGCPAGGPGTGARVFDIRLEGNVVLSNLDIFREAGCAASTTNDSGHPIVKRFTIPITDGTLDLRFDARQDNAKLSAIEILSAF